MIQRLYQCTNDHQRVTWWAHGERTRDAHGNPDFTPEPPSQVECPTCGEQGTPVQFGGPVERA